MARISKPPLRDNGYYTVEDILRILASALNPDNSAFTLPVSGTVGVSGTLASESGSTATDPASPVSVGIAATQIFAANDNRVEDGASATNNSSQTVYVGYTSAVTTSSGTPLPPGVQWVSGRWKGTLYGIVASGSADVRRMEVST